ncbi:hypothetical protein GGX14DRAFT_561168 [Mycena pura]|uniref:Uncharacterized protein n=1 Tax=Mycena pura TaxID=153505 RepID=A0AAD6VMU6_9AGAR|nr:hypothetical protein GGX14DRAFT_561168 [Mycena pura]
MSPSSPVPSARYRRHRRHPYWHTATSDPRRRATPHGYTSSANATSTATGNVQGAGALFSNVAFPPPATLMAYPCWARKRVRRPVIRYVRDDPRAARFPPPAHPHPSEHNRLQHRITVVAEDAPNATDRLVPATRYTSNLQWLSLPISLTLPVSYRDTHPQKGSGMCVPCFVGSLVIPLDMHPLLWPLANGSIRNTLMTTDPEVTISLSDSEIAATSNPLGL